MNTPHTDTKPDLKAAVSRIVENIWTTLLQLDVRGTPDDTIGLGRGDPSVTGCIHITGAWKGSVILELSACLANRITSDWLETGSTASSEDVQDVVGELVNILGGNVKALLPRESYLSLPMVAEGKDYELTILKSRVLSRIHMECEGELIKIVILVREDLPAWKAQS